MRRQCPQTTICEEKGEPKQIRTEVPLLTSLTPLPLGQTGGSRLFFFLSFCYEGWCADYATSVADKGTQYKIPWTKLRCVNSFPGNFLRRGKPWPAAEKVRNQHTTRLTNLKRIHKAAAGLQSGRCNVLKTNTFLAVVFGSASCVFIRK